MISDININERDLEIPYTIKINVLIFALSLKKKLGNFAE